jgi:glycosyltransferase involved in cell wall biosynthesis
MCAACCDGETVIGRGRVGWEEMAHEMKTGSIWLYPTVFDEISCVSAMEAMAAGSAVVSTMHGALQETCQNYPLLWAIPEVGGRADIDAAAADLREAAAHMAKISVLELREASDFAAKFDTKALVDNWCRDLFTVA